MDFKATQILALVDTDACCIHCRLPSAWVEVLWSILLGISFSLLSWDHLRMYFLNFPICQKLTLWDCRTGQPPSQSISFWFDLIKNEALKLLFFLLQVQPLNNTTSPQKHITMTVLFCIWAIISDHLFFLWHPEGFAPLSWVYRMPFFHCCQKCVSILKLCISYITRYFLCKFMACFSAETALQSFTELHT